VQHVIVESCEKEGADRKDLTKYFHLSQQACESMCIDMANLSANRSLFNQRQCGLFPG
jgi:hypothetical protein